MLVLAEKKAQKELIQNKRRTKTSSNIDFGEENNARSNLDNNNNNNNNVPTITRKNDKGPPIQPQNTKSSPVFGDFYQRSRNMLTTAMKATPTTTSQILDLDSDSPPRSHNKSTNNDKPRLTDSGLLSVGIESKLSLKLSSEQSNDNHSISNDNDTTPGMQRLKSSQDSADSNTVNEVIDLDDSDSSQNSSMNEISIEYYPSDDDDFQTPIFRKVPSSSLSSSSAKSQGTTSQNNNNNNININNSKRKKHSTQDDALSDDDNSDQEDWTNTTNKKKPRTPKIFFGTRTHSQISQVVGELKDTNYHPKMCILASRDHYCIHPKVVRKINKTQEW